MLSVVKLSILLLTVIEAKKFNGNTTFNNLPSTCKCKDTQQIAFNAKLGKDMKDLPTESVVIFDKATMNEGNGYQPNTGIFTCQQDGIYFFSWTILTSSESMFHTDLVVDGTIFARNYNDNTNGENYKSASQTVLVKLKTGNQVWIRTYNRFGKFVTRYWSTFSGFVI